MKRVAGLSLLLFVGFGAAAPAKRPSSGPPATAGVESRAEPSSLRVALAHLHEEVRRSDDGSLVIENGNYQASFSQRGGVRFMPRIEARYERQLSWQYRARSIDTDTSRVPLDPVRPVVSATGDHVVDFERPGLIERYEGRRGGVEQIFVLTRRPAGRGDVRISGEVTFAGTSRRRGAAVEFAAGGASLTYGVPTAYDAHHQPVPVRTELQGDRLHLVLDGAALRRVTFPVTIDPLFGATTTYIDPIANALGHYVGVAYNWDRGEFLVVFDATVPGTVLDREIRAKRFFENGDAVAASYAVGRTFVVNLKSKVAYDLHTNTYLVVSTPRMPSGPGGWPRMGRRSAMRSRSDRDPARPSPPATSTSTRRASQDSWWPGRTVRRCVTRASAPPARSSRRHRQTRRRSPGPRNWRWLTTRTRIGSS